MYQEFYRFTGLPFQLTPDATLYFGSAGHNKAMAHLTYGLHQGEGFIVITGEVGAGKTTLVDLLLSQLDRSLYVVAKLVTTQLGGDDLLRMVASAFGLYQPGMEKTAILKRIEDFLASNMRAKKKSLLIVDEAQNLPNSALEELRMLSNLSVERAPSLQGVLLGQPQFRAALASPELEQLRQRVIAAYHLGPMSEIETKGYIMHRLKAVGWSDDPLFADDTFAAIHRDTGGIPRRINTLCSRILLLGFLEERHALDGACVEQVADELQKETAPTGSLTRPPATSDTDFSAILADLKSRTVAAEKAIAKHDLAIKGTIEAVLSYVRRGT